MISLLFSTLWAFKVIERSHVSLLLIDAAEGPTNHDMRIAGFIADNWKSCVVVVNKWDLAANR
jgi:GTP-binding protein